jgi:hypothetical protein
MLCFQSPRNKRPEHRRLIHGYGATLKHRKDVEGREKNPAICPFSGAFLDECHAGKSGMLFPVKGVRARKSMC